MSAAMQAKEHAPVRPSPLRAGRVHDSGEHEAERPAGGIRPMPGLGARLVQRCPGGCPGEEVLRRANGGTPPRAPLLPTTGDLLRWQTQREAPVRSWVADHEDLLRGNALEPLTRRVRSDLGDAVADLGDAEIHAVLQTEAAARGITLAAPAPAQAPAAGGGVNLGAAARSIAATLDSIPTEVGFDQRHGWPLLRHTGPTVGLRSGGTRIGARIGWSGDLHLETSVRDFRFDASLSADRWQLALRYRLGPAMPDLSRLASIFTEGEAAVRRVASVTAGTHDLPAAASEIGEQVTPIRRAVTAASQVAGSRPGDVSFELQTRLTGPGPAARRDAPPIGFEIGGRLTVRF